MIARVQIGTFNGEPRFRVSPPGKDVRLIPASECMISEENEPRLKEVVIAMSARSEASPKSIWQRLLWWRR